MVIDSCTIPPYQTCPIIILNSAYPLVVKRLIIIVNMLMHYPPNMKAVKPKHTSICTIEKVDHTKKTIQPYRHPDSFDRNSTFPKDIEIPPPVIKVIGYGHTIISETVSFSASNVLGRRNTIICNNSGCPHNDH